jgi:transposase
VAIEPRANGRPICSGCGKRRPGYDRLPPRRCQFVPLWGIAVFFVYALRRVECPQCGIKAEGVPWATGKEQMTTTYQWFLARWAKRLAWQEVAHVFHTSWNTVYRAVTLAATWGIVNRSLEGITAIGADEIQWRKGHRYLTLVYQIQEGCKRLLWVAAERTEESLRAFFGMLGKPRVATLEFACSDMWKPHLNVLAECAGQAVHVLDRYHVMAKMNNAIDEVRAEELLLNWFEAKGTVSAGSVEGLNYNAKLVMKKAYGFRTLHGVKIALYHRLGALPEPRFAHEFC